MLIVVDGMTAAGKTTMVGYCVYIRNGTIFWNQRRIRILL